MISAGLLPAAQKFLLMQELKNKGFSQYKIRKLVKEGKLIKLNKSYYENTDYHGEESDFYYVSSYAPKGVVCLLSVAFYYNLTTFIPDAVDVAIPRKAKISTIPDWPPMKNHYYTDDRYKLVTLTVSEDILINYLKRKDRNLNRLLKYAELMKCDKVLRHYLEMSI